MSLWYRIKKLTRTLFYVLTGTFLVTMFCGMALSSGHKNEYYPLLTGFLLSGVVWGIGYAMALSLTKSQNAIFWHLTPMTPYRFFRENYRRCFPAILTVYVFPSLFIGVGIFIFVFMEKEYSYKGYLIHEWFNIVLFIWVIMLISIYDMLNAKMRDTFFLFPIRHLFIKYKTVILCVGFVMFLTAKWTLPFTLLVFDNLELFLQSLMVYGVVGEIILYLLSPVSSFFATYPEPVSEYTLWIATVIPLAMGAHCLLGIRKAIVESPDLIEDQVYEGWIDDRKEYENSEEKFSVRHQEEMDALGWNRYYSTFEMEMAGEENDQALAYDCTLSSEEHVFRAEKNSVKVMEEQQTTLMKIMSIFDYSYVLFLLGAILYLYSSVEGEGHTVIRHGFLLLILFHGLWCLFSGTYSCAIVERYSNLPIRFSHLLWIQFKKTYSLYIFCDLLATYVIMLSIDRPVISCIPIFLFFGLMRIGGGAVVSTSLITKVYLISSAQEIQFGKFLRSSKCGTIHILLLIINCLVVCFFIFTVFDGIGNATRQVPNEYLMNWIWLSAASMIAHVLLLYIQFRPFIKSPLFWKNTVK